jgi:hypothetical protein
MHKSYGYINLLYWSDTFSVFAIISYTSYRYIPLQMALQPGVGLGLLYNTPPSF